MLHWTIYPFEALHPLDIHALFKLRVDVFVVEQQCPYPEVDLEDLTASHVLGKLGNTLVAYARILPPTAAGIPHIGRVVVHQAYRGTGVSHELMRTALAEVIRAFGSARSALAAQSHLQKFYETHGFVATGAVYDLDGIPHIDMERLG